MFGNAEKGFDSKWSSADTFPTCGILIFPSSGKYCPEKEYHCKAAMEHVGIGHFFLDHYAVSLWKSLLSPSFTDSTFMIRIQKLISLRLAGDDLAKEIPSKCYSDPSREN